MNTATEQVEVTPELLDGILHVANAVLSGEAHALPLYRNVLTAPRALALVKRIRELEDEVVDMRRRLVPRLHDSSGPPLDF